MLDLGILIGAQKCGTTALHRAFRAHPQVAASEPKETFYFSDLNNFARGEDWYRSLFSFGPKHKIGLDSSTHYAMYPSYTGVPRRMKDTGWNFRFVYVLRNPVARIQSFYQHLAILPMHGVPPLSEGLHPFPLEVSSYFTQLEVYREVFGRKPILVVMHGEMQTRPGAVLRRICSHFKIDPDVGIALRTTHAGEADYQRTLVIEEWRRRGNVPPQVNRNNLYRYMRLLPEAERNDIHGCVRMAYTLSEDHKREIRSMLTPEMKALKRHYGVDVSRWGFAC